MYEQHASLNAQGCVNDVIKRLSENTDQVKVDGRFVSDYWWSWFKPSKGTIQEMQ